MKEYLKMSDVFCGDYHAKKMHDENGNGFSFMVAHCLEAEYAAHAINSHDELVENYRIAAKERDEWEARACKEASRVNDLDEEVNRLRELLVRMKIMALLSGSFAEDGSSNPVNQWLFDVE